MPRLGSTARSTVFAFKCRMGTPLARIDFNLVLRGNEVRQLFFSVENDVHFVCLRLRTAVTRLRFVNALIDIERKPLTNFKRPVDGIDWSAFVFLGNELRDGTGLEIRMTLKRHMDTNNPGFFQSHSTTSRHITHLLQNTLRRNHFTAADQGPSDGVQGPPPRQETPSTQSDLAETIPLDSPHPTLSRQTSRESTRTEVLGPNGIFTAPYLLPNGQPNLVELLMHLREMIAPMIQEMVRTEAGFDLQATLTNINTRLDELRELLRRQEGGSISAAGHQEGGSISAAGHQEGGSDAAAGRTEGENRPAPVRWEFPRDLQIGYRRNRGERS